MTIILIIFALIILGALLPVLLTEILGIKLEYIDQLIKRGASIDEVLK